MAARLQGDRRRPDLTDADFVDEAARLRGAPFGRPQRPGEPPFRSCYATRQLDGTLRGVATDSQNEVVVIANTRKEAKQQARALFRERHPHLPERDQEAAVGRQGNGPRSEVAQAVAQRLRGLLEADRIAQQAIWVDNAQQGVRIRWEDALDGGYSAAITLRRDLTAEFRSERFDTVLEFPGQGAAADRTLYVQCSLLGGSRRFLRAVCTDRHPSDAQRQQQRANFSPQFPMADYDRAQEALRQYSIEGETDTDPRLLELIDCAACWARGLGLKRFAGDLDWSRFENQNWAVYRSGRLNDEQADALQTALRRSALLMQGPPGTGRTCLIAELIHALCYRERNNKILAVCPSNAAADQLALQTEAVLGGAKRVFRLYSSAAALAEPLALHLSPQARLRETAEDKLQELLGKAELTGQESSQLRNLQTYQELQGQADAGTLHGTERSKLNAAEQALCRPIIRGAHIVVCTLSQAGSPVMHGLKFPRVIMDEAEQANIPMAMIPLMMGATHLTVVGDPMQLAPFVHAQAPMPGRAEGLEQSFWSALHATGRVEAVRLRVRY